MRFLLYNIRYGTGAGNDFHFPVPFYGYFRDTVSNMERIAEFIEEINPDIIGLLEVDNGSFRSRNSCQAALLAERVRHSHVFENKYGSQSRIRQMPVLKSQGNALLTNRQIVSERFHYFRRGMKRLVIEAELPDVSVFLVHLSLGPQSRRQQLIHLAEMVNQATKPVIVAGDFNVFWGDHELDPFLGATGLLSANEERHPSYPSCSPKSQLDFILHSPELRPIDFRVPQIELSDHIPLVCDFELQKEPTIIAAAS